MIAVGMAHADSPYVDRTAFESEPFSFITSDTTKADIRSFFLDYQDEITAKASADGTVDVFHAPNFVWREALCRSATPQPFCSAIAKYYEHYFAVFRYNGEDVVLDHKFVVHRSVGVGLKGCRKETCHEIGICVYDKQYIVFASESADREAKESVASEGECPIYVYSNFRPLLPASGPSHFSISMDGRKVSFLDDKGYFRLLAKEGEHEISATLGWYDARNESTQLDCTAGETYFAFAQTKKNWWGVRLDAVLLEPAGKGRARTADRKLVLFGELYYAEADRKEI